MNWYKKAQSIVDNIKFSTGLEEEIQYIMDTFNESPPEDRDNEILTRPEAIHRIMQDMSDSGMIASDFKKELENFGAKIGIFKEISKEEMANTMISGRGRKYDFKRGDKYYVFDSWEPLIGVKI
jgi:hypothetical protein